MRFKAPCFPPPPLSTQELHLLPHALLPPLLPPLLLLESPPPYFLRFKDDDERGPIEPVSTAVLPHLLSVFKHLLAEPSPSLLLADYIKLVLKSYWSFTYVS